MTKRAHQKFARRDRDTYDTPSEAVTPLKSHLPASFSYWEPCAGSGALAKVIPCDGHVVLSDIEPRASNIANRDALSGYPGAIHVLHLIITNPPWHRPTLHCMIEHFSDMRPTWLLFDADWVHTRQAAPYMPRLRKIVSVGRVSWMGNGVRGFDNCAWHFFDKPSDEPAQFFGRAA